MHMQNVLRQNAPRQNTLRPNVPRTKRHQGQNVPQTKCPRDKMSQGTKRPTGQNVPVDKGGPLSSMCGQSPNPLRTR